LDKWIRRISIFTTVTLFACTIWFSWLTYERTKLNQRYEHAVELREELNEQYQELNKRYDQRVKEFIQFSDRLQSKVGEFLNQKGIPKSTQGNP